jgi:hypothetical protein
MVEFNVPPVATTLDKNSFAKVVPLGIGLDVGVGVKVVVVVGVGVPVFVGVLVLVGVGVVVGLGVPVGVFEGVGVGVTTTSDGGALYTFITAPHTCLGCFEPFGYIMSLMFGCLLYGFGGIYDKYTWL